MNNSNTTAYIRKLVKIVYQKEKQIENMKKMLRERSVQASKQNIDVEIDHNIRMDLEYASSQMKEVNMHVLAMEKKVIQLEQQLEHETNKNSQVQAQNTRLQLKLEEAKRVIAQQYQSLVDFQATVRQLTQKKQQIQANMSDMNKIESERMESMKCSEDRHIKIIQKFEKEISQLKSDVKSKDIKLKNISEELDEKGIQSDVLSHEVRIKEGQIITLTAELEALKEKNTSLSNEVSILKLQVETLQDSLNMKEGQAQLLSENLKDYQQFAFEIAQHIEAAYHKHCSQGKLRSSKKLISRLDNCKTRFEFAFCKMDQIQLWMDSTAEKLEKVIKLHELPNQTLDNLSIIAESFEQKLELCDLTERIEKQKEEQDKNEEMLLDNLQKEVQKSQLRERSKLVELDEMKEVLKVTKDINRELLNQINSKEYVISQCRKLYAGLIGNKANSQYRNLKNLLNIRN